MPRLWAKIIRKHRIDRQATAECVWEEDEQVLILRVTDAQLAGSVD